MKYILDFFQLVREVKGVIATTSHWAVEGAMTPLFALPFDLAKGPLDYNAQIAARGIEATISASTRSEGKKAGYLNAIDIFRRCYPKGHTKFVIS